jgi:hypothetical protein
MLEKERFLPWKHPVKVTTNPRAHILVIGFIFFNIGFKEKPTHAMMDWKISDDIP